MITVDQWERGDVRLSGEYFHAEFEFSPIFGLRIARYVGEETGTVLSPKFSEVLEL